MKDKTAQFIANYLPRKIVYFAAIRLGAWATTGKHGDTIVPELTFVDAIKRWEQSGEQV